MSDKFKRFLEFLDRLLHCHETHPSGTTKREKYYSHPIEPGAHEDHKTAKTGMWNVCYCRDCHAWYRIADVRYREDKNHNWRLSDVEDRGFTDE